MYADLDYLVWQNICWGTDLTINLIRGNNKCFKDLFFKKVAALVSLFLIRLRFQHWKSMAEVIKKIHGQNTVKKLRKLEKADYRLQKVQIIVHRENSGLETGTLCWRVKVGNFQIIFLNITWPKWVQNMQNMCSK